MKQALMATAKLFASALLASIIPTTLAQQDFSKVEIKTIHVAKNVYMLQGSGGNTGVSVGVDGTLIVDDQFAPLAGRILDALKRLNPNKSRSACSRMAPYSSDLPKRDLPRLLL